MNMRPGLALACLLAPAIATASYDAPSDSPGIFGWIEWVEVGEGEQRHRMKGKLDSGALTSSLDARGIDEFRRDGNRWVRFELHDRESGDVTEVERPVKRVVRIVRHSGNHQRRPVIEWDLCLGDTLHTVEFTLVDRSNFNYPVLLGRRALDGYALIDSGETYLRDAACGS
ncbi:MAG: ATP-dependent zinc protease family protein [Lysobacteraceae bacterium]